jgi:hypothetical protein
MIRSFRLPTLALAAAGVLLAPAAAHAKVVYPSVKSISPKTLAVGQKLTIRGKNFRRGHFKNTVVFKLSGKRPLFVRADSATSRKIVITVPETLLTLMKDGKGIVKARTFKLRVIAQRFGKSYTTSKTSPKITPPSAAGGGGGTALSPYDQCKAGVAASPAADADGDGLSNALETSIKTDPCIADTDTDGLLDGYEYSSALELNASALPYPGKRPWPNPLDPSDVNFDFDGDGLPLHAEYKLWVFSGGNFPLTVYSDGTQNSGGAQLVNGDPVRSTLDLDGDNNLTDDERDADGDGLSNVVELRFRGTKSWWEKAYKDEKPYTDTTFYELEMTDPDVDGDTLLDGADDQDHDGWSNYQEMQVNARGVVNATFGYPVRVQPYNPCLPDPYSRTCSRYVPFENAWPPFDDSEPLGAALPFSVTGTLAIAPDPGWNGLGGPQGGAG